MTKLSKINLIRILAACHLNQDQETNKQELKPIKSLELSEKLILHQFKSHFMNKAIRLNKKLRAHTEKANSFFKWPVSLNELSDNVTIAENSVELVDAENYRQANLIYDMSAIDFLNLIACQNVDELILDNSKIDWIKKDRSTLYKISIVLTNWINVFASPNHRHISINNFRQHTPQNELLIKNNENDLYICNSSLPEMNAITTNELYLSTLLFLDNTYSSNSINNRNQTLIAIKKKYFKIDKLVNPLQRFISENPKSIDWTWRYLLKKVDFGYFCNLSTDIKPDRDRVNYLIFYIGSGARVDANYISEINKSIRKAWSVENTRKKNDRIKPITLSKKHYQKLQTLAKQNGVSEKKFISELIDRELK